MEHVQEKAIKQDQEIEIKLALDNNIDFSEIHDFLECHRHEPWESINMCATYYDTPSRHLKQAQIAYRIRQENENIVATIKAGDVDAEGIAHRLEINRDVKSAEPDLTVFLDAPHAGLVNLLELLKKEQFEPVMKMEFTRCCAKFEYGEAIIEVAVDRGSITKGVKVLPIWELELELKEGTIEDLKRFRQTMEDCFQAEIDPISKYQKGLAL